MIIFPSIDFDRLVKIAVSNQFERGFVSLCTIRVIFECDDSSLCVKDAQAMLAPAPLDPDGPKVARVIQEARQVGCRCSESVVARCCLSHRRNSSWVRGLIDHL
jgi:hypothetical protein